MLIIGILIGLAIGIGWTMFLADQRIDAILTELEEHQRKLIDQ